MLRRRSQDDQTATSTVTAEAGRARDPEAPKGRPTPKRSEARSQRRGTAASGARPANRKDASRQQREMRREALARQRQALAGGDERYLPDRDKGKARRAARDFIDSRRHVAELFIPLAVVILVLSMVPSLQVKDISLLLWMVLIVAIIGQSVITAMALKRHMRGRFPDNELRGVTWYALMRSLQMRRMRLPKPQVKRGARTS